MSGSDDTVLERTRVREVAGVFRSPEGLESAVDDLLLAGFDRADIDVAGSEALRQRLGIWVPPEELADVPEVPRRPFLAREDIVGLAALVIAIGAFVVAAAAGWAVIATGGGTVPALVAALLGAVVGGAGAAMLIRHARRSYAIRLETQAGSAGLVLWVRVRSRDAEERAAQILGGHGARAVRTHEIEIAKRLEDLPLSRLRIDPWLGEETLGTPN